MKRTYEWAEWEREYARLNAQLAQHADDDERLLDVVRQLIMLEDARPQAVTPRARPLLQLFLNPAGAQVLADEHALARLSRRQRGLLREALLEAAERLGEG
jgi:hypothetical protein